MLDNNTKKGFHNSDLFIPCEMGWAEDFEVFSHQTPVNNNLREGGSTKSWKCLSRSCSYSTGVSVIV